MSLEKYERGKFLKANPKIVDKVEEYNPDPPPSGSNGSGILIPEVLPPDPSTATGIPPSKSIPEILKECGFDELVKPTSIEKVEAVLRKLTEQVVSVDSLRRETLRAAAIDRLQKLNVPAPARLVGAAVGMSTSEENEENHQGQNIILQDPEPWPEPVDGDRLLGELAQTFRRFVILPDHGEVTTALFILHTHAIDAADISPLLGVTSPEKRCGKSLLLEISGGLVRRPLPASNISPAALFRAIEKFHPCLLIDEADAFMRDSDEFRGLLNAGHRRSTAIVIRTVGDEHEPKMFSTWGAKAIALIGKLPDTLADRSIPIRLRRKRRDENVERVRHKQLGSELERIRRKAARWTQDHMETLRAADPEVPEELNDRAGDNWRPLLAIADTAGGSWPERARKAAEVLSGAVQEGDASVRALLLADLRDLFTTRKVDELPSATIVDALKEMEEKPWPEWKSGKPMTTRQLARLLSPFGVKPEQLWIDGGKTRGYRLAALEETFSRYLGSDPVEPVGPCISNNLEENASGRNEVVLPDGNPANSLKTSRLPVLPDENPSTAEGNSSLFSEEIL